MLKIFEGDHISKGAVLSIGCTAVLFNETRNKLLLTQRADNGQWCIPGGHMESGESAAETAIREMWEETGAEVEITKLIGIYTTPNIMVEYDPGVHLQPIVFNFEVRQTGGILTTSDEVTDFGFFGLDELGKIDFMSIHEQRVIDALANKDTTFIR